MPCRTRAECRLLAIKTFRASAVVPPGLVTLTRNCDAGSFDCFSSSPLPATVARASCMAMSAGQAELFAGRSHRLDQQEDIGRPASGQRA